MRLEVVGLSEGTYDGTRRVVGTWVVFRLEIPPPDWPKCSMISHRSHIASMVVHLRLCGQGVNGDSAG
jgi:hypothetical protein